MATLPQTLLSFLKLHSIRIFQFFTFFTIISKTPRLARLLTNHLPSPPTPTPPSPKSYNEPLEVAHSRIHHALDISHTLPTHLLTSLTLRLSTPWIESPPSWRLKEAVKLSQRRRRERRYRIRNPIQKRQPVEISSIYEGKRKDGKSTEQLIQESVYRKDTQRKIWEYEILILGGQAEKGEYPGIEKEARKRYEELVERMKGESEEEAMEDFVRAQMEVEVDAGREFGIEWEVWRLVLEWFLEGLDKKEAREVERERKRLVAVREVVYREEKRDYARSSILKRLFVEDLVLKPTEWEEMLKAQIKYVEGLERDETWGLAETRAIVRELEGFRREDGFPVDFVAKYGGWAIRGDVSLSETDRREIGEDMVRLRNDNSGPQSTIS